MTDKNEIPYVFTPVEFSYLTPILAYYSLVHSDDLTILRVALFTRIYFSTLYVLLVLFYVMFA